MIIGVCGSGSGQEKMEQVAEDLDIQYPIAKDYTLESAQDWRVMWWPTYGVIDRHGKLRALGLIKKEGIEQVVKTLLKEKYDPKKDVRRITGDAADAAEEDATEQVAAAAVPDDFLERPDEADLQRIVGKAPPKLQVTEWANSEPLNLEALKGNVVLLDYWATW